MHVHSRHSYSHIYLSIYLFIYLSVYLYIYYLSIICRNHSDARSLTLTLIQPYLSIYNTQYSMHVHWQLDTHTAISIYIYLSSYHLSVIHSTVCTFTDNSTLIQPYLSIYLSSVCNTQYSMHVHWQLDTHSHTAIPIYHLSIIHSTVCTFTDNLTLIVIQPYLSIIHL